MKMYISQSKIEVFHDNKHKIGIFEYSALWDKWHFRTEYAGLDVADLKKLYKYCRKLNRRLLLGKIYKHLII